ncbi:MAG: hypothetical protein ABJA78_16495 [Ferruginibacter sp.]
MKLVEKLFDKSTFFFENYLRGKDVLPIVRRIVDPLLSLTISSTLFERFYFKYKWLDISDYKGILDFVVKGRFVVPLTLFVIVHFVIRFFTNLLFSFCNDRLSDYLNKLLSSKEKNANLYNYAKPFIDNAGFRQMIAMMSKQKRDVEETFYFVFKILITSVFYFIVLPKYGILLFLIMMLLLFVMLIAAWFCYLLFDFLPRTITKLKKDAEQHMLTNDNSSSE